MERSLEELIVRWEAIAQRAATYNLTLDDWLNDLDLRDIIGRRISTTFLDDTGDLRSRLDAADRLFRTATRESKRSLWGPTAGAEHDPAREWWYFRYPTSPGAALRAELKRASLP
jgi:hypothetical protein